MKLKIICAMLFAASIAVANAQTPPPAAASPAGVPPTWAQGRTAEGMNPSLVPNPSPVTAKAVNELQIDKLKVIHRLSTDRRASYPHIHSLVAVCISECADQ